ncbi:trigger factor [Gephyromycinifex aptenodytis]|uniref:trigger factor n=1 Tax=Gephyromycinifex aptenodytis TaxID=2716227 RepID=UPI001446EBD3|nr:trigger factor [Gephyromycinifex aptenodytis]
MKSSVETLSPTRVKMTVEVPYEELKPSVDAAYKSIGAQISVPGFRPGKVPARLIEQRVGKGAVLQEAVNEALPNLYGQALAENEVRPMGQPEVDLTELPTGEGEQLVFTAELDVRPTIELPDFSSIEVVVDPVDDSGLEEETNNRLEELRKRFGTLVGVERPGAEGDFTTIDIRGEINGEEIDAVSGVSYEIGTRTMVEGLDDALIGMSEGESKTFNAPLAGGEHEGQEAEITVTLTALKERELPELDDDFAQMASEFDTLEELTASLREQAKQAKSFEQGIAARDKILEHLLDTVEIALPESAVEAEIQAHFENGQHDDQDDEAHRTEVEENVRKALRSQLLLDEIAEKTEVQVGQQELIEYLIMTAQQYGMEPGQLAQAMQEGDQIPAMASEVARRKALASVMEQAKVTDTNGEVVDLSAAVDGSDEDESDGDQAGAEAEEESAPVADGAVEAESDEK